MIERPHLTARINQLRAYGLADDAIVAEISNRPTPEVLLELRAEITGVAAQDHARAMTGIVANTIRNTPHEETTHAITNS